MRSLMFKTLSAAIVILAGVAARAEVPEEVKRLPWTPGPATVPLTNGISLNVPAGFQALTTYTALHTVAAFTQASIDETYLAFVTTVDGSDTAWIKQAAGSLPELAREDGVNLLKDPGEAHYLQWLKKLVEAGNTQSKAAGQPTSELVGWLAEPTYTTVPWRTLYLPVLTRDSSGTMGTSFLAFHANAKACVCVYADAAADDIPRRTKAFGTIMRSVVLPAVQQPAAIQPPAANPLDVQLKALAAASARENAADRAYDVADHLKVVLYIAAGAGLLLVVLFVARFVMKRRRHA